MARSMDPTIDTSWREEIPFALISQEQVDSKLQCCICLEDFTLRENVRRLDCAHVFHDNCISPWLNRNNICPTCRRISTNRPHMNNTEELVDLDDNSIFLDLSADDSSVEFFSDDEHSILSMSVGDGDESIGGLLFDTEESNDSTSSEEMIDASEEIHAEFMDDDDFGDVDIFEGSDEDSASSSPSLQSDDGMFGLSDQSAELDYSEMEEILDEL